MTDDMSTDATWTSAVQCLNGMISEFTTEIGSPPTLGEFLEILGMSAPVNSPAIEPVLLPLHFEVKLSGKRRYEPGVSRVASLNDATFVNASSLLLAIGERIVAQHERSASPTDLASGVLTLLRSANVSLADVQVDELLSITARARKGQRPTAGDIIAIPLQRGGFRLAAILAINRFGVGLGLFEREVEVLRIDRELRENAIGRAVYTDDQLIADGTWRVVRHDGSVLSLFPHEPEIYHSPNIAFPGIDLGAFGAAETPTGAMRKIGEDEARRVGLLDNTYQQVYLSSDLNEQINEGAF
jgi:hypothetical protein